MIAIDLFEETAGALSANKARSALTVLGIVIGIASVIVMVSVGQGAQSSVESSIQSIGSNLLIVMPGAQRGPGTQVSAGRGSAQTLTQEDADAIAAEITSTQAVAPVLSGRYQVTSKGTNTNTSVMGTTAAYTTVRSLAVAEGSFLSEQQVKSKAKVAVLGPTTRDDLFGEDAEAVGQTVRINGIEFKVVGVTQAKGGSGFGSQDDIIYVPLSTAQTYLAGSSYVSSVYVSAESSDVMPDVEQQITDLLMVRHNITDSASADFSIMNQSDIVEAASSVTETFTLLLAAVAGISLIVGGIGIMNMMLTNVTERTKEIGLRKAIGAKRGEISAQFLAEAIALTLIGGFLGIVLGVAVSWGASYLGIYDTTISLSSIALAFGVSAAIGIAFGYYPARRAAGLNPIVALRYE